ncbi:MAG: type II secretion system F family protein [Candidatus Yanofskybacteria bacterium]|nr:type II secretion system F family protein [Candidatus Yanofskybacteria bacterium]
MKFQYQARNNEGQAQSGVVEASSRDAALQILDRYGLYVTVLEGEASSLFSRKIEIFSGVSRKEIMIFARQLAIMFKAEVPLIEALQATAQQTGNKNFKEKLLTMSQDVEAGVALSQALSRYPDAFSSFFINMVKSAEASGKLSDVLEYLAQHEEREYELNSKVKGAFVYPAFVVFIAGSVLFMMMFFVVPNITKVIVDAGGELPAITQALARFTEIVRTFWWLFLFVGGGSIVFLLRYLKTPEGKRFFGIYALKVPLVGSFLRMIYLTRFAENLSTLVSGGIPIVQALEITANIVGNEVYKELILSAQEGVKRGERISTLLKEHPREFPPLFTQMVFVGEKSGALDQVLSNVVGFYQKEVERTITSFIGLLEPALIVVLGVSVGGLMASLLLPLYQAISF